MFLTQLSYFLLVLVLIESSPCVSFTSTLMSLVSVYFLTLTVFICPFAISVLPLVCASPHSGTHRQKAGFHREEGRVVPPLTTFQLVVPGPPSDSRSKWQERKTRWVRGLDVSVLPVTYTSGFCPSPLSAPLTGSAHVPSTLFKSVLRHAQWNRQHCRCKSLLLCLLPLTCMFKDLDGIL